MLLKRQEATWVADSGGSTRRSTRYALENLQHYHLPPLSLTCASHLYLPIPPAAFFSCMKCHVCKRARGCRLHCALVPA